MPSEFWETGWRPSCPNAPQISCRYGFIPVSYPVSYLNRPFQVPPQICHPQILALCMKTPQSRLRLNLGPLASANVGDLGCLLCFPGVWLAGSRRAVSYPVSYPVSYLWFHTRFHTGFIPVSYRTEKQAGFIPLNYSHISKMILRHAP